eukprot:6173151-Pleurochrysis_carterae.AAC.10
MAIGTTLNIAANRFCRNRRRTHFTSSLACTVSQFCIGMACVLAERSRSASGFLAPVCAWPTSPWRATASKPPRRRASPWPASLP